MRTVRNSRTEDADGHSRRPATPHVVDHWCREIRTTLHSAWGDLRSGIDPCQHPAGLTGETCNRSKARFRPQLFRREKSNEDEAQKMATCNRAKSGYPCRYGS